MAHPLFSHLTNAEIERHFALWAQSEKFAGRNINVPFDYEKIKQALAEHRDYGLMIAEVCICDINHPVKSPTATDAIFTFLDREQAE